MNKKITKILINLSKRCIGPLKKKKTIITKGRKKTKLNKLKKNEEILCLESLNQVRR